jgi:hypothetical protein
MQRDHDQRGKRKLKRPGKRRPATNETGEREHALQLGPIRATLRQGRLGGDRQRLQEGLPRFDPEYGCRRNSQQRRRDR